MMCERGIRDEIIFGEKTGDEIICELYSIHRIIGIFGVIGVIR